VLSPEQKQEHDRQIRDAELRRYEKNPHREIIMQARQGAKSARKRGGKYGAHEFTITEDDLDWPTHCPALGIELHYPGRYHHDPAGASLERINVTKGYVPGNVRVISLRANLLRKDATAAELVALADYYLHELDLD
jgi:UDP-N-acetylenolpyruvoylglucosamine reductase